MKWYQPIECDKTVKNPLVCDYSNLEAYGYDEYSFKSGIKIDDWNENIYFRASEKKWNGFPDNALQNVDMIPIYSEKVVSELNRAEIGGIQYLPIKVIGYCGNIIEGFSIANFLNFIDVFDYEKSVYNRFAEDFPNPNVRGQLAGVRKFVLKKEKLEGLDVIRLKEYNLRFFVSDRFRNIFVKNKFTGYSFKEVELV